MCESNMGGGCPHKTAKAAGLLALRIAVGIIFIYQGYGKLAFMHDGAVGMFTMLGIPGGGAFWAYFIGALELVGGLMVLLGIYTRYAAVWLSAIMVVAMATVHRAGPFTGIFLPLALLGANLSLIGTGAGKYRLIACECCCKRCKMAMNEKNDMACDDKTKGGCCGGGCSEKKM